MRTRFIAIVTTIIAAITFLTVTGFEKPEYITQVNYTDLGKYQQKQVDCLAQNIYHEARSESETGQQAVAFVTLNRANDERFPSDVCGVVKQKTKSTCQFSWFCQRVKLDKTSDAYREALQIALFVYTNYAKLNDITGGALYYHADYVRPKWKLQKTISIGRHIFYKEKEVNKNDAKTKSISI